MSVANTTTCGALGSPKGHCWYVLKNGHGCWSVRPFFWPGSFCWFAFNDSCARALLAPLRIAATVHRGPRWSFLLFTAKWPQAVLGQAVDVGGVRGLLKIAGGFLFVEVVGDTPLGVGAFECELPSRYVHES